MYIQSKRKSQNVLNTYSLIEYEKPYVNFMLLIQFKIYFLPDYCEIYEAFWLAAE